jgi:hypothetical protein
MNNLTKLRSPCLGIIAPANICTARLEKRAFFMIPEDIDGLIEKSEDER